MDRPDVEYSARDDESLHQTSWQDFVHLALGNNIGLVDARQQGDPETVIVGSSTNDTSPIQIVRIPLEELKKRRFELPSRSISFGILVSDLPDLKYVEEILLSGAKTWKVYAIVYDPNMQQELESLSSRFQCRPVADVPRKIPLARLWQPDSMVETVLLPLLRQQCTDLNGKQPSIVLDIGSGVGRDVCFLSEELYSHKHLQFVGADQRYRENDDTTLAFWERRGQLHRCRCLCVDLKDSDCLFQKLEMSNVLCVYAVRYWNETLFERLARELTRPGTIVAISQFGKPHDDYEWTHSTPKVRLASFNNSLTNFKR